MYNYWLLRQNIRITGVLYPWPSFILIHSWLLCVKEGNIFFYLLLNTFIWATNSQSWVVLTPMEHLAVSGDMDVCKQELFKTFNYLPQMLVVPRLRKPSVSFFCLITQLSALPLYFIDTEYPDFFYYITNICHFLLQGIFLTQGLNLCLLHSR